MQWYKGDIAQAVAESRQKNAIFVVFISGNDAASGKLLSMIEESKIRTQLESEHFVAIRIESDSQPYMQFASIYQMAPVPSIFFIGSTGTPIEIGTSIMNTSDELDEKIKRALQAHLPKTQSANSTSAASSASSSFITGEKKTADAETKPATNANRQPDSAALSSAARSEAETEIVCEGDVCYKKPKETKKTETETAAKVENNEAAVPAVTEEDAATAAAASQTQQADLNARLAATRELLAQKRRDAEEEEKKQEKERELRRRREGKEIQHMQEWQREKELKDLKDNIRRERAEEQQARERIRAQIAADRAERAQRSASVNAETAAAAKETTPKPAPAGGNVAGGAADAVRLQFRFVNGETKTHTFGTQDTIATVRGYVSSELLSSTGHKDFTLATVYPRHEFTAEDDEKTLVLLGLFPSAVILVIVKESTTPASIIKSHGGIINIFSSLIWSVLSPIFSVFNYMRGALFNRGNNNGNADSTSTGAQKRANEDSQVQADAAKRRNLDRFMTGPSTSRDAAGYNNAPQDDLIDQHDEQKPYRRYGASNVHRLSDKRKDSDDENATWNGNSTQQQ